MAIHCHKVLAYAIFLLKFAFEYISSDFQKKPLALYNGGPLLVLMFST